MRLFYGIEQNKKRKLLLVLKSWKNRCDYFEGEQNKKKKTTPNILMGRKENGL